MKTKTKERKTMTPKKTSRKKISRPKLPKKKSQPKTTTKKMSLGNPQQSPRKNVKKIDSSQWSIKSEIQKEGAKKIINLKGLIYGAKWTGKTHIGCSAFMQKKFETKKFIIPSHSPVRVLDCNHSAETIAIKDFEDEYKTGKIITIDAYINPATNKPIEDPIKRVAAVRKLITECIQFTDGCLIIDGFDSVERDAMYYIYRHYKMYEKEDGTLWYAEKTIQTKQGPRKQPEREVGGIIPRMYAPRNMQIRKITDKIVSLAIPVIIISHAHEEYNKITQEPTGKIISNIREFVEDDLDYVIYFENTENMKALKKNGKTTVVTETGRRITIHKNRFQKTKNPEIKIVEAPSFEFIDIFETLIDG